MPTQRSEELRALAQRFADSLPDMVEEVVVTGSVSRGVADDVSDVEMLVVVPEPVELDEAFAHARVAGLTGTLESWGPQGGPDRKVFGYYEGVPFELIWWPRELVESRIDAIVAGETAAGAEAILNGIALRTGGAHADWQERLATVPDEVAAARIEEAALPWGGFTPAGLLTIIRPGDRIALMEWIFDGAMRVLQIVYALNRVWPHSTKRISLRVEPLEVKPERLVERIEAALSEPDPREALLTITQLELDTVRLAPSGPNVDRAAAWLAAGVDVLQAS